MPYKAVCEELWSIRRDAPGRLLYLETRRERRFVLPAGADFSCESSGMRRVHDKNNNSHPRSEVRKRMESRAHVPAGNSLSVGNPSHSLSAPKQSVTVNYADAVSREPG